MPFKHQSFRSIRSSSQTTLLGLSRKVKPPGSNTQAPIIPHIIVLNNFFKGPARIFLVPLPVRGLTLFLQHTHSEYRRRHYARYRCQSWYVLMDHSPNSMSPSDNLRKPSFSQEQHPAPPYLSSSSLASTPDCCR